MADGSSAHFCMIGTANATVFPEPVRLPPMQSRPSSIFGMHSLWMAVGLVIAIDASDATSHGCTFNETKSKHRLRRRRALADDGRPDRLACSPLGPCCFCCRSTGSDEPCLAGGDNRLRFSVLGKPSSLAPSPSAEPERSENDSRELIDAAAGAPVWEGMMSLKPLLAFPPESLACLPVGLRRVRRTDRVPRLRYSSFSALQSMIGGHLQNFAATVKRTAWLGSLSPSLTVRCAAKYQPHHTLFFLSSVPCRDDGGVSISFFLPCGWVCERATHKIGCGCACIRCNHRPPGPSG
jgi:hypothetical protein